MQQKPNSTLRTAGQNTGFDVNKLIIDTRIKFFIYARREFRLQMTHQ